jgi:hypothetical protein
MIPPLSFLLSRSQFLLRTPTGNTMGFPVCNGAIGLVRSVLDKPHAAMRANAKAFSSYDAK